MSGREIDEILDRAEHTPHTVAPALLERIADSIKPSMRPVRPLLPAWLMTSVLVLICATVALVAAARAGFEGFEKLGVVERLLIFTMLGALVWAASTELVSEMIPGSRRRVSPRMLLIVGGLALLGVFALLFRDYHTENFVSSGIACLTAGLIHAAPTGLAIWLVLRRGFAVNSVVAGLVGGMLAGLAGLTLLELHCVNFQAFHVLVWHTAVVVVSGAAGALAASALGYIERIAIR